MDSAKMSKSLGNVVRPRPIVHVLGMDALRYYLLRETVFGQDGNFSYDALVTRYNSDLANGLGNLASRTAAMIEKNCGGKIPKPGERLPQDDELAKIAQATIGDVLEEYEQLGFSRALEAIWALIAAADKYLTSEHPWSLGETEADQKRRATILWTTAEVLRDRHGADASGVAGEHVESLGAARARWVLRERSSWTDCGGDSSRRESKSASRKRYFRELKKQKRLRGWKPWKKKHRMHLHPLPRRHLWLRPLRRERRQLRLQLAPRLRRRKKSGSRISRKSRCAWGRSRRRSGLRARTNC